MSHGPRPSRGFDAAMPVARARGHVMFFRRTQGSTANLMISGGGLLAIVRLRSAPRLYAAIAEIAWECRFAIDSLRVHPQGGPVSLELWLYSRYGALRFFRVLGDTIVEIGADGKGLGGGQEGAGIPDRAPPAAVRSTAVPGDPPPEALSGGTIPSGPVSGPD